MKKSLVLLFASLTLLSSSLISNLNKDTLNKRDTNILIELKGSDSESEEDKNVIKKEFIKILQSKIGLNYRVLNSYSNISNMLNIEISSLDYEKVKNISYVINVFENKTFSYEDSHESYFAPDTTNNSKPDKDYSRIEMNIPSSSNDGTNTLICIIDDSFKVDHEMFKDLDNNYKYTKSTLLTIKNSSGFHGKSAGYLNNKIPFYYSYATNDTTMSYEKNTKYHGSHVAGIAGANNTFLGAAPNAQLALMRVTDNTSRHNFSEVAILNALEDAMALKCDVINMSFGTSLIDNALSQDFKNIFNKLNDSGIQVNFAAGNDGKNNYESGVGEYISVDTIEPSEIGSYAAYSKVNSIGATNLKNDDSMLTSFSTASNKLFFAKDQILPETFKQAELSDVVVRTFQSLIDENEEFLELEYALVGYGTEEEYKNIDVNGKIAIVKRGGPSEEVITKNTEKYYFTSKIYNAYKNGAIGIIICNTKESDTSLGNTIININPGEGHTLTKEEYIPTALSSTYTYDLLMNESNKVIRIGRRMDAEYSSDGSQTDLSLTPDISAPGTNIYSGISNENNENLYAFYDGTSMATPNTSGAMANIISNFNGTDLENYKKTLMARMQSTTTLLRYPNGSYLSPRKVGAGLVNVEKAIESDVYFSYGDLNKAKIELKNNEDIKNGNIKFTINTHNESNEAKNYKATLYIQVPATIIPDAKLEVLNEKEVKTDKDELLISVSYDVTIQSGDSTLDFSYALSEENKKYLEKFTSGTQLEGYVVFESKKQNSDDIDLSIPFMGFYGDYNDADAVEPFTFERDENKAYESDIVNQFIDVYPANPQYSNGDFRSIFAVGNQKLTTSEKYDIQNSKTNILDYYSEIPYNKKKNLLNLGIEGESSYIYIQQFVSRSIKDNRVTFKNKKTGEIVLDTYLSNLNYSAYNGTLEHPLIRSCYTSSSFSGQLVNLAYLEIELIDENNNLIYEEGEYELSFTYTLQNGFIQPSKTYNVILSKTYKTLSPQIVFNDFVVIDNKKYYEILFRSEEIKKISFGKNEIEFVELEDDEYKIDIDVSEFIETDNSYYLNILDIYNNSTGMIIAFYDNQVIAYKDSILDSTYTIYLEKSNEEFNEQNSIKTEYYSFNLISNNVETNFGNSNTISFTLNQNDITDKNSLKLYYFDNGLYKETDDFTFDENGVISFNLKSNKFKLEYKSHKEEMDQNTKNKFLFVLISVGSFAILLFVGTVILILKANKKKKE